MISRRRTLAALAALVLVALTACGGGGTSGSAETPAPYVSMPASAPGVVTFYLGLPFDGNALRAAAQDAADPGGTGYRRFTTVAAVGARFGPDAAELERIGTSVTGLGLGFAVDPTRVFARVTGTPTQWEKALGAPLQVAAATAASPFTGYALPNRVPDALVPNGTSVLMGYAQVYDRSSDPGTRTSGTTPTAQAADGTPVRPAAAAPWPVVTGTPYQGDCSNPLLQKGYVWTPGELRTAYGADKISAPSSPPVVTVLDLGGGWSQNDLELAARCFGYTAPIVVQTQGDGVPAAIAAVDGETSLDLQTVSAVAPGATLRLVQTTNGGGSMLDGFARAIAGTPLPDVVSVSYGSCAIQEQETASAYVTAVDDVLATAALAGVGVYVAAGDSGSTTCGGLRRATLSYPAVSAFVTAVGGTRVTLGQGNVLTDEVVWNDSRYGQQAAGGGGTSVSVRRPWYQDGVHDGTMRTVPDVAAQAAIVPGWPVVISGALQPVGGTSGATPFTAAVAALVSAGERSAGRPPVGLANGWLYRAASSPAAFHDVASGSNDLRGVGCCTAATGYDRASGLGSPNWSVLPGLLPGPGGA